MLLPPAQPVPFVRVKPRPRLRIISAAGAGFPGPAQDWADNAIDLVALLCLGPVATFLIRVSGLSMIDVGLADNDMVVVDRDTKPASGHLVIAVAEGGFIVRHLAYRSGVPHHEARNAAMTYPAQFADETKDSNDFRVEVTEANDMLLFTIITLAVNAPMFGDIK